MINQEGLVLLLGRLALKGGVPFSQLFKPCGFLHIVEDICRFWLVDFDLEGQSLEL